VGGVGDVDPTAVGEGGAVVDQPDMQAIGQIRSEACSGSRCWAIVADEKIMAMLYPKRESALDHLLLLPACCPH
jgi:hypothetical protein